MINNIWHALCTVVLGFSVSLAAADTALLPTLAPVLKNTMPAIVNVAVQGINPGSIPSQDEEENADKPQSAPQPPRKFQSIGSGVIIDPKEGIIITNDHVIRNATMVTVTLNDGRRLKAKIIGGDSETDVAVLKVYP